MLILSACEQIIEVDPNLEEPRLIVDAIMRVDEDADIKWVYVNLGNTETGFSSVSPPRVQLMEMIVLGNVEDSIEFNELPQRGRYRKELQAVDDGDELVFSVGYEQELYLGTYIYERANSFQLDQKSVDNNQFELTMSFNDDPDEVNYYLWDFGEGEYAVLNDEYFNGQTFDFKYRLKRDVNDGEDITVSLLGCDRGLYDYMEKLIDQSNKEFGPFETPVATIRGNLINVTEIDNDDKFDNVDTPDNFPLGYFAVVQEVKRTITLSSQ